MPKTALLLIFCGGLLTACAQEPEVRVVTKVEVIRPQIPPSLTDCRAAPPVPVAETQADVAEYILDLYDAHGDCRDKLRALVGVVRP
jgi:type IV pilus biogenesis protein CpaD/CtpE